MTIAICRPATIALRRIAHCPTCRRRRRFAATDALWYGAIWTCLGCGDAWGDGERMERPFRRGWRDDSKARARKLWDQGVPVGSPQHRAWFAEQVEATP